MTVSPRYDQYKDAWDTDVIVEVYSSLLHFISFRENFVTEFQN
jgi:hypothetical protein